MAWALARHVKRKAAVAASFYIVFTLDVVKALGMDSFKLIREKRKEYEAVRDPLGIDTVLRHLDVAERHFLRGREDSDYDLFTDVIFRTNQVFEGILKELYIVLSGEGAHNKRPYDIEEYLTRNRVFSVRVLDYFSRYRKDWRNPAAHDYRLDFSEQEAFLAISTVSSFCFVAIDEMIKFISEGVVEGKLSDLTRKTLNDISGVVSLIADQLPHIYEISARGAVLPAVSEQAMLGALEGLLQSVVEDAAVSSEAVIASGGKIYRPDILVEQETKRLVIEVKSIRDKRKAPYIYKQLVTQMQFYAQIPNTVAVIGILLPTHLQSVSGRTFTVHCPSEEVKHHYVLFPENLYEF